MQCMLHAPGCYHHMPRGTLLDHLHGADAPVLELQLIKN